MTEGRTMTAEGSVAAPGRYQLTFQKNRALAYTAALLIAWALIVVGVLQTSYLKAALISFSGLLSALLLAAAVLRGQWQRFGIGFDLAWLVSDGLIITWAIGWTGGAQSPLVPFYVANVAAAAFCLGRRWIIAIALGDTLAYFGILALMGDIRSLENLMNPLGRVLILFGASFLFFRGLSRLREEQEIIGRMQTAEMQRVDEVTRLTTVLDVRTSELENANLRIRQGDRLKSQFLSNMSHELRTPLNSIIGFSDVLLARLPKTTTDKHLRFLTNINRSGQHLLGIINDLLDLSKIEAGKMELSPESITVSAVVDAVCGVMREPARTRNISFKIDIPDDLPGLQTDAVKIKQIIYNLISNAEKFSNSDSTVRIKARHVVQGGASPPRNDGIEISVTDDGVGIEPKDHRVIFEEFRQVDGTSTREFGGTGLGLALVKRLVELHCGTITLRSQPGEGSTFTITLPRKFQGRGDILPAPHTLVLPAEGGTRILVVEDDPTAYETISKSLSEANFVPVRARNCEETLKLASTLKPSAITLDIMLPGIDGLDILRLLKQDPKTVDIPVIIVSLLDNRELALALGAADYFIKPFTGDGLVKRLSELLPTDSSTRNRVLLIDDEPMVHDLVEARLAPQGYKLEHAMTGREGIAAARAQPPDLILLDLMMDGMDGFEVAQRLKRDVLTAGIPVVVLTSKQMSQAEQNRLRGKIAAQVNKQESPGLVTVIEDVMRRQSGEGTHG